MDLRAVEKRNCSISKYQFTSASSSFGPFGRVAPNNDLIPCILNLFDITFARSSQENPSSARATNTMNRGYFGHVVVSNKEARVLRIILKIFVFYPFSFFFSIQKQQIVNFQAFTQTTTWLVPRPVE